MSSRMQMPWLAARLPLVAILLFAAPATGAGFEAADLPASYTGTLPCGDCNERVLQLNLRPDGVFHLREVRSLADVDSTAISYELGVWEFTEEGDTLLLYPTLGATHRLIAKPDGRLMAVDPANKFFEAGQILTPMQPYAPFEPSLFLRGKFSLRGHVPVFRECVTGHRLLVEPGKETEKLIEAYQQYRPRYGDDLLVSLIGKVVSDPHDAEGPERLLIEQYGGIWPVEVCGRWISLAKLENTDWFLMDLGDSALLVPMEYPEPYLRLDSKTARFEIVDGCNRLSGAYELDGERIRFTEMERPTEECPIIADNAAAYRRALEGATSWAIQGTLLHLYDVNGNEIAWFEPRFQRID